MPSVLIDTKSGFPSLFKSSTQGRGGGVDRLHGHLTPARRVPARFTLKANTVPALIARTSRLLCFPDPLEFTSSPMSCPDYLSTHPFANTSGVVVRKALRE